MFQRLYILAFLLEFVWLLLLINAKHATNLDPRLPFKSRTCFFSSIMTKFTLCSTIFSFDIACLDVDIIVFLCIGMSSFLLMFLN